MTIKSMNAYRALREVVCAKDAEALIKSLVPLKTFQPTADTIISMVTWRETPQGFDFWEELEVGQRRS